MSTDDPFAWDDDRSGEAVVAVGTALAIEQPDAVRSPQGWIDESGLLAFNRRSVDMELGHDSFGGRRPPSVSAGRRSA